MSFDDELARFEEITKDVDLSRAAQRDARKLRASKARVLRDRELAARGKLSLFGRILWWAESRARTQQRPWANR